MQAFLSPKRKGLGYTLFFQRNARLIIEIVQPVVVPTETALASKHPRQPVMYHIGIVNIFDKLFGPLQVTKLICFNFCLGSFSTMRTFLGAYSDQAAGFLCILLQMLPLGQKDFREIRNPIYRDGRTGKSSF
jgi:hypothetical protein